MRRERPTLASIDAPRRGAPFPRSLYIALLAVAMVVIFAASATAHTVAATATCGSVTFNWAIFNASGSGNGGLNTPTWKIVFTPASGAPLVIQGATSFAGSTSSLTVPIPSGDGTATASSSWTSAQTRDGNANSGSSNLTIANCAPPAPAPAPAPVTGPAPTTVVTEVIGAAHPVASAAVPGILALSTNASAARTSGGAIRDTALLSGGSSPTGTITFSLYSASDTTCSTVLGKVSVAVNGDGSYISPAVAPNLPGSYQWVASYSGDKNNRSLSGSCNDPTERATISAAVCVTAAAPLVGLPEIVTSKSLSAYVPALGVKSVTFYLDGRKLETLTKPSDQRFAISVEARRLSYGVHRLSAKVTMLSSRCASEATGSFIRARPNSLTPTFAG
jgi:hypothetical protein